MSRMPQRFLKPEILSRISTMELLARTVVEGFVSGLHRSPYKGFSVEFMEYRQYVPGDDPKRIDWKKYARSDRLFVKEFEDETNTSCHILLDISGSMNYSTATVSKFEYAAYLAASLAYFMIKQRDAVGLYTFDDKLRDKMPPKSTMSHLQSMLQVLNNVEPTNRTAVKTPFDELAESITKRGIVIVISDFLDDPDAVAEGIKHFRFNGNEVILFQICDPSEMKFKFEDIVEIEDIESGEKIMIAGEVASEIYTKNFSDFDEKIRWSCSSTGADFSRFVTDQPLDFALFKYLAARQCSVGAAKGTV